MLNFRLMLLFQVSTWKCIVLMEVYRLLMFTKCIPHNCCSASIHPLPERLAL